MATDLTAGSLKMALAITGQATKGLDLSSVNGPINIAQSMTLAFGTGANAFNQVWHDRRVLAGAATETTAIDLAATLTNCFGTTVTFANVKLLVVVNRSNEIITGVHDTITDAAISVGDTAANEFLGPFHAAGDGLIIPAGAFLCVGNPTAAGWSVTAATGDILLISNEDATDQAVYDILIAGEST